MDHEYDPNNLEYANKQISGIRQVNRQVSGKKGSDAPGKQVSEGGGEAQQGQPNNPHIRVPLALAHD